MSLTVSAEPAAGLPTRRREHDGAVDVPMGRTDRTAGSRELTRPHSRLSSVLRDFDELRRQVAIGTRGVPGAFAGFDSLRVTPGSVGTDDAVLSARATMVTESDTSQTVHYVARRVTASGLGDVVAEGVGRTVALGHRPTGTTLTRTQAAPAHPVRGGTDG